MRHSRMLITLAVSATDDIRDDLRSIVRDYLADEVSFFELEYQPSQKLDKEESWNTGMRNILYSFPPHFIR
jgi:hypothetical protein